MNNVRLGRSINNGIMVLYGLASVMIGTTLPEMIRDFDLSYSQGGLIVSMQAGGGLVIMLLGLLFADRVRKPLAILISLVGAGIGIALVGIAPAYWFVVVAFFTIGTIWQLIDMLLNALTGDIEPVRRSQALSILHLMYGVGAFIGPSFARWLLNLNLSWSGVYYLVGGLYLAGAAVCLIWARRYTALGASKDRTTTETAGTAPDGIGTPGVGLPLSVTGSKQGWLSVVIVGIVLLFYAIHQLSTTAWLPTYMGTVLGTNAGLASLSLSLYWVGIILSRLIASVVAHTWGELRLLVWTSIAGGIMLVSIVLIGLPTVAILGFVLAGLLTGATIPLAMSVAYGLVPGRTGVVTSLAFALMTGGRLAGPWIVGRVGDSLGMRTGILFAAAVLLIAGVCAAAVFLTRPKERA